MDEAPTWQPLPPYERRVLGVLIEKNKTSKSPETYPMTLNSIVVGCNQKSNREPVYELDEDIVEEALSTLQKKGVVVKMTGSRADRWRHQLYELWKVNKVEMAILAELLLRGPQSEGDLRGRASRMDEIADLDELRTHLKAMSARNLVIYLSPPDRRGALVTHGFHEADELDAARKMTFHRPETTQLTSGSANWEARFAALESRVAELEAKLSHTAHPSQ
jgi:uncharacterized protein